MHYFNSQQLHCLESIKLPITYYCFRKCHSRKTFSPEELYAASAMDCAPLGVENEVMVLADVTTMELSWPGDVNGQLLQGDKESG